MRHDGGASCDEVLRLLRRSPVRMSCVQIAVAMGRSSEAVLYYLQLLRDAGLVESVRGSRRGRSCEYFPKGRDLPSRLMTAGEPGARLDSRPLESALAAWKRA